MNLIQAVSIWVAGTLFALPLYGAIITTKMAVLGFIFLCFNGTIKKSFRGLSLSEKFLLSFTSYAVFSTLVGTAVYDIAISLIAEYVGMLLVFILVFRSWNTPKQWSLYGFCYVLSCLVLVYFVMLNWRNGVSFEDNGRYTVEKANNNYIAYTLATALPIAMSLFWSSEKRRKLSTLLLLLTLLVFGATILLTGCRGATIGYFLGMTIVCARLLLSRPVLGMVIVLIMAGSILFFYTKLLPSELQDRLVMCNSSTEDISSDRYGLWAKAIQLISQHPIVGNGAGSFSASNPSGVRTHNIYLSIAAEFGAIGTLTYFPAIVFVFISLFRDKGPSWRKWAGGVLLLVWLPISLTGVWEFVPQAWFAFAWIYRIPQFESQ